MSHKPNSTNPGTSANRGPGSEFRIECYWLDFNGASFAADFHMINVYPFPDKLPIQSLPAYPLRFADPSLQLLESGISQGRKVLQCIERKHMMHDAACLLLEPTGHDVLSFRGNMPTERCILT